MDTTRQTPNAAAGGPGARLLSLDVLRGLTIIGMILVNSAAGMHRDQVFGTLLHSPWAGLTLADVVFPGFLMMVGVSIPLALARARAARGGFGGEQGRRIAGRTLRLFLLGFILSNLWWARDFAATDWRLFGVLQRIALVYGACAALFFLCGSRTRLAILAAILLLYWPLALIPSPDGIATDLWQRGQNFVGAVDRLLFGTHIYVQGPTGYDPEGLLGTLPAIAHGLIGVAIGEHLLAHPGRRTALRLALAGLAMTLAGLAWGLVFPIVKDIWSSSFVLLTCGITTLVLALLHLWLDGPPPAGLPKRLLLLLAIPFGINAIAAYVIHQLTGAMPGWDLLQAPFEAARPLVGARVASLLPIALYIAFIWACVEWLRRKGWIFKI